MTTAYIFPGQGSQKMGMCKDIYEEYNHVKELFNTVDEALRFKLSKIIFEGPEEKLTQTENTQPALMLCSLAIAKTIEHLSNRQLSDTGQFAAGHSLGEFSALTVTNGLSITDSAKLLQLRGQAMQKAVPKGEGAMFALLGANFEIAQKICQSVKNHGVCEIANDNSVGQLVLSGNEIAINAAIDLAKEKGFKAIKLKVSAPFHCSLMKPAQQKLKEALKNISINKPTIRIISNVTADKESLPDSIKDNLVKQVTATVRWTESVRKMIEYGVDRFVEIGPGSVLSGLIKRIDSNVKTVSVQSIEDIHKLVTEIDN
ncbi:MAG: ACP S-malonyltransferase [Rickettsiales bacterium]